MAAPRKIADFTGLLMKWIRPIFPFHLDHPIQYLLKSLIIDHESIMLRRDLLIDVHEIEDDFVVDRYRKKRTIARGGLQARGPT